MVPIATVGRSGDGAEAPYKLDGPVLLHAKGLDNFLQSRQAGRPVLGGLLLLDLLLLESKTAGEFSLAEPCGDSRFDQAGR